LALPSVRRYHLAVVSIVVREEVERARKRACRARRRCRAGALADGCVVVVRRAGAGERHGGEASRIAADRPWADLSNMATHLGST
jgi:hypothetical protein